MQARLSKLLQQFLYLSIRYANEKQKCGMERQTKVRCGATNIVLFSNYSNASLPSRISIHSYHIWFAVVWSGFDHADYLWGSMGRHDWMCVLFSRQRAHVTPDVTHMGELFPSFVVIYAWLSCAMPFELRMVVGSDFGRSNLSLKPSLPCCTKLSIQPDGHAALCFKSWSRTLGSINCLVLPVARPP
jgi:hypothetical protein